MNTYIILSPSKEMAHTPGTLTPLISPKTQQLITHLSHYPVHELAHLLKISDKLAMEVYNDYQEMAGFPPKAKAAYLTYQGIAFRQIDWDQLDLTYADKHLRILSALYGPLAPNQAIYPYRLDFNTPLRIGETSLKAFWRSDYQAYFRDCRVYNLASGEFSQHLKSDQCQKIDIDFYDYHRGPHQGPASANAKKLRGRLAFHLLAERNFDPDTFASFDFMDYQLSQDSDFDRRIIYIHQ